MSDTDAVELYRKYRPESLDELVGQDDVVELLEPMIKNNRVPRCLLASGPSGTGKTTVFRILRNVLQCSNLDFCEINAASNRGIDMVRDIQTHVGMAPSKKGGSRIWMIDEAHALTGDAQTALLKTLEDIPSHVYFFLASTDPQKLKNPIITRSTHLKFKDVETRELIGLLNEVCMAECEKKLPESVAKKISQLSDGSPRKCLVLLHPLIDRDFSDEEGMLEVLEKQDVKRAAIEICRGLMNKRITWPEMAAILKGVDEDPESIRWMVLGYMTNTALGGKPIASRAVMIIEQFRDNFYDSKKAGLVAACYSVISGG